MNYASGNDKTLSRLTQKTVDTCVLFFSALHELHTLTDLRGVVDVGSSVQQQIDNGRRRADSGHV